MDRSTDGNRPNGLASAGHPTSAPPSQHGQGSALPPVPGPAFWWVQTPEGHRIVYADRPGESSPMVRSDPAHAPHKIM